MGWWASCNQRLEPNSSHFLWFSQRLAVYSSQSHCLRKPAGQYLSSHRIGTQSAQGGGLSVPGHSERSSPILWRRASVERIEAWQLFKATWGTGIRVDLGTSMGNHTVPHLEHSFHYKGAQNLFYSSLCPKAAMSFLWKFKRWVASSHSSWLFHFLFADEVDRVSVFILFSQKSKKRVL